MLKKIGDYNVYETIGQGGFGTVKKIKHSVTGEEYAVKILDKNQLSEIQRSIQCVIQKYQLLAELNDHLNKNRFGYSLLNYQLYEAIAYDFKINIKI